MSSCRRLWAFSAINRNCDVAFRCRRSCSSQAPIKTGEGLEHSFETLIPATVVYMGAQKCFITLSSGSFKPLLAHVNNALLGKHASEKMVVGDRVRARALFPLSSIQKIDGTETAKYCVMEREDRTNVFCRSHGDGESCKLLAANIDLLVVVASFGTPAFSSLVVDRVLVAAGAARIPTALVINKLDLDKDEIFPSIAETYKQAGIPVLGTSVSEGGTVGLQDLSQLLRGKTSALYGLSGAGKSTILGALGVPRLRTGPVSTRLRAGRHTTSASTMHNLDLSTESQAARFGGDSKNNTLVIDTPGVRSFRPFGVGPKDLWSSFPESAAGLAGECRVGERCLHLREAPADCAVKRAVSTGRLPASRYASYAHMLLEMMLDAPRDGTDAASAAAGRRVGAGGGAGSRGKS